MDNGNLEIAGVPLWAINFINSLYISSTTSTSSLSSNTGDIVSNSESNTTLSPLIYNWDIVFEIIKIADLYNIYTLIHLAAAKIASRICSKYHIIE